MDIKNDNFYEETYAYLTVVIEFEVILNLLNKEDIINIYNEYKNYTIENKIIDESIKKLIRKRMI